MRKFFAYAVAIFGLACALAAFVFWGIATWIPDTDLSARCAMFGLVLVIPGLIAGIFGCFMVADLDE